MPSENELMIGRLATLEANDKKHDDDIKSIINDIKDIKDNLLQDHLGLYLLLSQFF